MVDFTGVQILDSYALLDDKVWEEFKKFIGEDGDCLVKELIDQYLIEAPRLIDYMDNDLRVRDIMSLTKHVHTLKGRSGQLGAERIANLCRSIEDAILEGQYTEISPLFENLKEAYRRSETVIRQKASI